MKSYLLAAALLLPATAVLAQSAAPTPAPASATTRAVDGQTAILVTAEQIAQMVARARTMQAASKSPNVRQTIIQATPYALNLEYRIGKAPASVHPGHAELMVVIDGAGTLTTGGTLVGSTPNGADSLTGSDIADGAPRTIAKGDMMIVPENTPHMLLPSGNGPLVLATILLPRTPAAPGAAAPAAGRGAAAAPRLYHSASETAGLIAAAQQALPASARFFGGGTFLSSPQYRVGLELRSPRGIASVHKNAAEFMFAVSGEGILETGGTVINPRDTGNSIDGDSQAGSTINRMKVGDFIFVPRMLPHLARTDGHFVLATMQVPGGTP